MKDQSQKKEAPVDQEKVLMKKFCLDCKTTKTPLWRVGPSGPKSLCNACGIRFRKKDSETLDVGKKDLKEEESFSKKRTSRSKNGGVEVGEKSGKVKKLRNDLKVRLRALGKEVVLLKRQRSRSMRKHRKIGEVEQAALLLMALSCGSVSA